MWTQKDCVGFKNAIKKESGMGNHSDCMIKVGSGETVTVSGTDLPILTTGSSSNSEIIPMTFAECRCQLMSIQDH